MVQHSRRSARNAARALWAPLAVAGLGWYSGCGLSFPRIEVPPLPPIDPANLPLPAAVGGGLTLIEVAGSRIVLDLSLRDPITAVGTCTDLVTYCVAPPARSLDACVASVAVCATPRPWEEATPCCPRACGDAYREARAGGAAPLAAFDAVYFRSPDCFPGVRAALVTP